MLWFSNQDASMKNVLKALVQCPFKVSPVTQVNSSPRVREGNEYYYKHVLWL